MSEKHIYKVVFINREQVYEIYAKSIYQGDMYGFVIVEDLVFGVKRSFIPLHEIVRIDQVKRRGIAKIISNKSASEAKSNVATLYTPEKN
jgi:hypothetical protein